MEDTIGNCTQLLSNEALLLAPEAFPEFRVGKGSTDDGTMCRGGGRGGGGGGGRPQGQRVLITVQMKEQRKVSMARGLTVDREEDPVNQATATSKILSP